MLLSLRLFSAETIVAQVIVWCIVVLAGFCWIEWIYHSRGKAVMKHYSKRSFHEAVAVLLFLLSTAILFFLMWLWEINNKF